MSAVTDMQARQLLAPVERWYAAYTLTQRREAGLLAAMALDLIRDSGMTAAQIRQAVMALAGWPTAIDDDVRDCHPKAKPDPYGEFDPNASYAVAAPHRAHRGEA